MSNGEWSEEEKEEAGGEGIKRRGEERVEEKESKEDGTKMFGMAQHEAGMLE